MRKLARGNEPRLVGPILACSVVAMLFAPARTWAANEMSLAKVLAEKFEVKSTVLLPSEQNQKMGGSDHPLLIVTFQKASTIAVCTVGVPNWETLPDETMTNETICDVYPKP